MSEVSEEQLKRWRKAAKVSQFILMPDGRQFQIMWRLYEQFGVRHPETGEQYAFTHEEAIAHGLVPLIVCPLDMARLEID